MKEKRYRVAAIIIEMTSRLYNLERIYPQQVDLKSALDSKDFLLNNC